MPVILLDRMSVTVYVISDTLGKFFSLFHFLPLEYRYRRKGELRATRWGSIKFAVGIDQYRRRAEVQIGIAVRAMHYRGFAGRSAVN